MSSLVRPRRGRRVNGSTSDVAKRADMDRRCEDAGGGVGGGESGSIADASELRRHDAEASLLTRAAGGGVSLGVVGGSAAVAVVPRSPWASSCFGMPGWTSHLNGTEPGLLNDSSTAITSRALLLVVLCSHCSVCSVFLHICRPGL